MKIETLARKLVAETDEKRRGEMCKGLPANKSVMLVNALKDICFAKWTSEPIVAQKTARALKTVSKKFRNDEIVATAAWISGIASITEGKLTDAVKRHEKAYLHFCRAKKGRKAAQTNVSKLIALALLGRYDEAISSGKRALRYLKKYKDNFNAGKIEINLANLISRQDRHLEAEKYFLSAYRRFRQLRDVEMLTAVEVGLAITYAALNQFKKAEGFYRLALSRALQNKMMLRQAQIEASMGNLATFRGRFDDALRFLESSRRKFSELKMPHDDAVARLEKADIYLELNLIPEAHEVYSVVVGELTKLRLQGEAARGYAHLARVQIAQGSRADSSKTIQKAIRLYHAEKNEVGLAESELTASQLAIARRNFVEAVDLARTARKRLQRARNIRLSVLAQRVEAEALIAAGQFERAQRLLLLTYKKAAHAQQFDTAQSVQVLLGKVFVELNNFRSAKTCFKRAIAIAEQLRAPLPSEEFRIAFFSARLAPYEELARLYLKERNLEESFALIENMRGRSLSESFDRRSKSNKTGNASSKLSRELADLREELNWFYSRLDRANRNDIPELESEVRLREKKIAETMRRISATAKKGKSEKATLDLGLIKLLLGRERILIEYVNFDGQISAFAITEKEIRFFENIATEKEISELVEGLNFQFGALRYGLKPVKAFITELRKRADFYLRRLHEKLLAPFENIIVDRSLVVVPVGQLHYVPFHALYDGEKYVVEKREVNSFPSATVFQHISKRRRRNIKNTLFVANADKKIPLVEREIQNLQGLFQNSMVMKGKHARVNDFLKVAGDYDLLHIACHGQFRADNPLFSSLHLNDGWVTVRDICAQKLKCEVVTLSACETGKNKIFGGEEILGLARGFLSAGARSLVLSLWTVNDKATTELMKDFYEALRLGANASQALRNAQCNFIKRGGHPYLWSPFFVVGS